MLEGGIYISLNYFLFSQVGKPFNLALSSHTHLFKAISCFFTVYTFLYGL